MCCTTRDGSCDVESESNLDQHPPNNETTAHDFALSEDEQAAAELAGRRRAIRRHGRRAGHGPDGGQGAARDCCPARQAEVRRPPPIILSTSEATLTDDTESKRSNHGVRPAVATRVALRPPP